MEILVLKTAVVEQGVNLSIGVPTDFSGVHYFTPNSSLVINTGVVLKNMPDNIKPMLEANVKAIGKGLAVQGLFISSYKGAVVVQAKITALSDELGDIVTQIKPSEMLMELSLLRTYSLQQTKILEV